MSVYYIGILSGNLVQLGHMLTSIERLSRQFWFCRPHLTVDIRSLHTSVKVSCFCDVKTGNQDKQVGFFPTFNVILQPTKFK